MKLLKFDGPIHQFSVTGMVQSKVLVAIGFSQLNVLNQYAMICNGTEFQTLFGLHLLLPASTNLASNQRPCCLEVVVLSLVVYWERCFGKRQRLCGRRPSRVSNDDRGIGSRLRWNL